MPGEGCDPSGLTRPSLPVAPSRRLATPAGTEVPSGSAGMRRTGRHPLFKLIGRPNMDRTSRAPQTPYYADYIGATGAGQTRFRPDFTLILIDGGLSRTAA